MFERIIDNGRIIYGMTKQNFECIMYTINKRLGGIKDGTELVYNEDKETLLVRQGHGIDEYNAVDRIVGRV